MKAMENWSLPWHALQRNLATDIRGEGGPALLGTRRTADFAGTWLGRARLSTYRHIRSASSSDRTGEKT